MATWCPCILYGKTHARNHGDPDASGLGGQVFPPLSSFFSLSLGRPVLAWSIPPQLTLSKVLCILLPDVLRGQLYPWLHQPRLDPREGGDRRRQRRRLLHVVLVWLLRPGAGGQGVHRPDFRDGPEDEAALCFAGPDDLSMRR